MRRLLALVTTFTLWLALPASAGGPNQVVVASPTVDGLALHRSGVQVVSTGADSVDSTNLALAAPTGCTGCEGIAVAYQALILTGHPRNVSPVNAAVAINTNCTSCRAYAHAHQLAVVTASDDARLSQAGRAKVADIRRRVAALVDSGLPFVDLDAQLMAIDGEFDAAVLGDLRRSGDDPHDAAPRTEAEAAPVGA